MRLPTLAKAAAAAVGLVIVAVVVMGYFGEYRAAKGTAGGEATRSVDATGASEDSTLTGAGMNVMSRTSGATPSWVIVQIEGLNLRTQPESDAEVIRGLSRNEKLRYVSGKTGWYQVTDKDGRTGWISSNPQYATIEK